MPGNNPLERSEYLLITPSLTEYPAVLTLLWHFPAFT